MDLLREFYILVKTIMHWIYAFFGFTIFFFVFGLERVTILGRSYVLPVPMDNSFAVQMFNRIRSDLLPPEVKLIVTNPMSAFLVQVEIALLLGFFVTFPYFLYTIILYLRPALLSEERKAVLWILIPLVFLFMLGVFFSYILLIPATFDILYPYATNMGIAPFFALEEFMYYVSLLLMVSGFMFLLPIFMVLLSFIHVVPTKFWQERWRGALLFFLILSAIITPDQTGITMIMLFIPLALLYLAGSFFAKRLHKRV